MPLARVARRDENHWVKIAFIGDAHLGCADYTERRRADFSLAFRNALELALADGATVVCLLGDVFDSAIMRRNVDAFAQTIRDVAPTLDRTRREGVRMFAIAGNHEYGRGREAGELTVLESLGFLRVLRGEAVVIERCALIGFPWQSDAAALAALPARAVELARATSASRRLVLLHNFVRGSRFIPRHLGEIDDDLPVGVDRAFVGHHHDSEELGRFVMPGSTEVQNIDELGHAKSIVIYDVDTDVVQFRRLPKSRVVVPLTYDVCAFAEPQDLFDRLVRDLSAHPVESAFVCVRVRGVHPTRRTFVTRSEVTAILHELGVVDRFVDVRINAVTVEATTTIAGVKIDDALAAKFGADAPKASRYVEECLRADFSERLVSEILK